MGIPCPPCLRITLRRSLTSSADLRSYRPKRAGQIFGAAMTLKLVKPGEPLPEDDDKAERLRIAEVASDAIRKTVEAGGEFWLLTATVENDYFVSYVGDALEMACTAEAVAGRVRLAEIGFGGDE